jgi:hypothetical protein
MPTSSDKPLDGILNSIEITILLRYYNDTTDYPPALFNDSQEESIISKFVHKANLLQPKDYSQAAIGQDRPRYEITERGRVYINHLLHIPLPVKRTQWVINGSVYSGDKKQ